MKHEYVPLVSDTNTSNKIKVSKVSPFLLSLFIFTCQMKNAEVKTIIVTVTDTITVLLMLLELSSFPRNKTS